MGRRKVGVVIVTGEFKLAFEGRIGLADATKTLKRTVSAKEKKTSFEAAVNTELGTMKIEGEIKDGKASKIKLGFAAMDSLDVSFAAGSDWTRPFSTEFKFTPLPDIMIRVGDWAFRGRVSGTFILYFGPDPTVAATLAKRGGQVILQAAARAGAVLHGLVFTEIGSVTIVGAVAIGAGVAAAAITWLGFVLYMVGDAHKEGRWWAGASQFAWGYGHMLMQVTHENPTKLTKENAARRVARDWKPEFGKKVKRWIDHGDKAALNALYYLGESAAAVDYNNYVTVYGEAQWSKLAAAHRQKYGEDYQRRENRYWKIVYDQVKERKDTFGVPLEVNP